MAVKVKELAAMLNLSPATVSLVLNNKPGISEATRNKVRAAVRELGCEELLEDESAKKILCLLFTARTVRPQTAALIFHRYFLRLLKGWKARSSPEDIIY